MFVHAKTKQESEDYNKDTCRRLIPLSGNVEDTVHKRKRF